MILQKFHLAEILVYGYHEITLHEGNRLMKFVIERKCWIIGVRRIIKKHIRHFTKCIYYKQETIYSVDGKTAIVQGNDESSIPVHLCWTDFKSAQGPEDSNIIRATQQCLCVWQQKQFASKQ